MSAGVQSISILWILDEMTLKLKLQVLFLQPHIPDCSLKDLLPQDKEEETRTKQE